MEVWAGLLALLGGSSTIFLHLGHPFNVLLFDWKWKIESTVSLMAGHDVHELPDAGLNSVSSWEWACSGLEFSFLLLLVLIWDTFLKLSARAQHCFLF